MSYQSPSSALVHREPVLDGIRGLAILLVLTHHFVLYSGITPHGLFDSLVDTVSSACWLGVDLFFVLSGFLITGILLDAKGSEHYFRNFYGRRALRIFPLYYVVLGTAFVLIPFFLTTSEVAALETTQGWYWLYASNLDVALNGWPDPQYFGHFWSLAVEEQFYLVWPLVVFSFRPKTLLRVSLGCFVGALALRLILSVGASSLASYVLMPTRMDAFSAGAVVALLARSARGLQGFRLLWRIGLPASALAAVGMLAWEPGSPHVEFVIRALRYSVIAFGFAALIAALLLTSRSSRIRGLFSGPTLCTLGKYSYALYVFHHPVVLLMRESGLGADLVPPLAGSQVPGVIAFAATAFGLSMLAALISWNIIEQPFLALKQHLPMGDLGARAHSAVKLTHRRLDPRPMS